jgi:signal transduction histidine kinase
MSIFIISSFLTVFTSLLLGFTIFFKNPKSKESQLWLLTSISVAVWSIGLGMELSSTSYSMALFWNKILNLGAIFVPIFFYHFIVNFLEKNKKERYLIWTGYFSAFVLTYVLFFSTNLFIKGVPPKSGFQYWIDPGFVYYFFLFLFVLYVLRSAYLLIRYKKDSSITKKRQINFLVASIIIGFGGGITNFFPQIINIYPFGNYFVMLYVIIITYAILKHHLFEVKIIATELFAFAVSLTLLVRTFLADTSTERLISFIIFAVVSIFCILLVQSVLQEVKIKEEKEKLAQDLEKANDDLASANDRLKELDQLKSEFLSLATHQIRSPLTAIKGYASLILEGDYGEISEPAKKAVKTIFDSCQNLVVIVNDFLNISRIEQGKMKYDLTDFNIVSTVEEVVNELRPNIESAKLSVDFKSDAPSYVIHADMGKIKQVIGNLIDNSIKYTKEGGISLQVKTDEKETDKIIISISDTGIGIAPEDMQRLFGKFVRARDAFRTNVVGTGLGLYVAKQMVEAQGGKIWIESPGVGKGSTFFIELPKK